MIKETTTKVRLALPSKGRMHEETMEFLKACGFKILKQKRAYRGKIEGFDDVDVVFLRPEDIVKGLVTGGLTLGIVGLDLILELEGQPSKYLVIIHDELDFGHCTLELIIPESWHEESINDLTRRGTPIRVATKFPKLTSAFLRRYQIAHELIQAHGALEAWPSLGQADVIVDLVSTGQTITQNRLKRIKGGCITKSQAVFVGNRNALKDPTTLNLSRVFLEYFEAYLRARNHVSIHANMKGSDARKIARNLFQQEGLSGLQGPTIAPVHTRDGQTWHAVHIIVEKRRLHEAISTLRKIGGSGVVVTPTMYIFEEEPARYRKLLENLSREVDSN